MKTVQKITEEYLKEHGYDGLVESLNECACSIREGCGGIMPYETFVAYCEPGYQISDPSGEFDFKITRKKPKS